MMHDFGVSFDHTVIMDLPLSFDPLNLAKNQPVVSYDPSARSRFGIFPRHHPERVRWFETDSCCIFHTANTWDDKAVNKFTSANETGAVNMLACRLTSASLVYSAGDVAAPTLIRATVPQEEEQCRLYYYKFSLDKPGLQNVIQHQFALSAVPLEFPSICEDKSMTKAKYVYGCSASSGSFGTALGRAVKIDCLVKIDVETLIELGMKDEALRPVSGCVDTRSVGEVLHSNRADDPIQVFKLPPGHYAQESRFVPRADARTEDDGFLLFYVFNEAQLDESGECRPDAKSELWIVDARNMKTVIGKVLLPQRVPYGLHGNWFPEKQILHQRPVETIRHLPELMKPKAMHVNPGLWPVVRRHLEHLLA
jgi:carotenoid cleavage dioxygenase-like enzyme